MELRDLLEALNSCQTIPGNSPLHAVSQRSTGELLGAVVQDLGIPPAGFTEACEFPTI